MESEIILIQCTHFPQIMYNLKHVTKLIYVAQVSNTDHCLVHTSRCPKMELAYYLYTTNVSNFIIHILQITKKVILSVMMLLGL